MSSDNETVIESLLLVLVLKIKVYILIQYIQSSSLIAYTPEIEEFLWFLLSIIYRFDSTNKNHRILESEVLLPAMTILTTI